MQHERDTSRPSRRRLLGALVTAVFGVLSVSVVLAPPAAALGSVQSGASWSAVTASVGPGTPLWTLDVTFTLSGISCTNGAELHYKIDTSAQKATLCTAGGTAPTSYTVRRPVFGASGSNISTLTPSSSAEVRAEVRDLGGGLNNNPAGAVRSISIPAAPKWIGMGDGYTSAVEQPVDKGTFVLNKTAHSWIQAATTRLNGLYGVPSTWAVSPLIIADSTATAVADGGSSVDLQDQIAKMESALAAAAGSWNWIGMSGGLVDVGIPAAMAAFYGIYPSATSSVLPWDATSTDQCPDLSAVSSAISAKGASIKSALTNVVARAKVTDPSVRVINVLYPFLTDETNEQVTGDSGPYVNPCAAGNRPVINALDSAITLSGTNVFNLDLRTAAGFGDRPTGTRVYQEPNNAIRGSTGSVVRSGSFLWLSREQGYPYPSYAGASQAGNASVDITTSQVSDTEPPVVTGVPLRAPDKNGWYNHAVSVRWTATDRPNPGGTGIKGASQVDTSASLEGLQRRWTSPEFCDNNSPSLCATGNVDLSTDFTPPSIRAVTDTKPNGKGWWNRPVTVSWSFTGDNVSGADAVTQAPSRYESLDVAGFEVRNGLGTMCDKAGNCADGTKAPAASVTLNIDQVKPAVSGTPSAARAPRNGWYRDDVTVSWAVTDAGGSGVDTSRLPADSTLTTDGQDKVVISSPAYDHADNTAKGEVKISIDRTPPAITIKGPSDGATYDTDNRPPPVICDVSDALSGVDGSCGVTTTRDVIRDRVGTATGSKYTITVSAKDLAGNAAPGKTISYIVRGDVDLQPPIVKARIERAADSGSWHTSPVKIFWDVTDPDTDPEPVADPPYTLATVEGGHVKYTSPEVCDGAATPELPKGNCAPAGYAHAVISLDTIRPNVSVSGPLQGATYTQSSMPTPVASCSEVDPGSGLVPSSCVLEEIARVDLQEAAPFSPPGWVLTYVAHASDHAGHTNTSEARTFTLYDFEQVTSGRMTGGIDVSSTKASFTLRCNGSPNQLSVSWTGGSFTLTHVTRLWCWDDDEWNEASPDAPLDALVIWGEGLLADGTPVHVRATLSDRGEPGKGADAMQVVVAQRTLIGAAADVTTAGVIHQAGGLHTGGGNAQAEEASGEGTNDSGQVNKPGK